MKNEFTYVVPSEAELRAIHYRAEQMRAEAIRAGFGSLWNGIRSLFTKAPGQAVNAQ